MPRLVTDQTPRPSDFLLGEPREVLTGGALRPPDVVSRDRSGSFMAGVVKPRTDSHVLPLCSQRKPDNPTEGVCDEPSEGRPLARREDDDPILREVGVRRIGRGQLPDVEDVRAETAVTPILLLARLRHSPSTSLQCARGSRPNRPRRSLEPPAARSLSRREVSCFSRQTKAFPSVGINMPARRAHLLDVCFVEASAASRRGERTRAHAAWWLAEVKSQDVV